MKKTDYDMFCKLNPAPWSIRVIVKKKAPYVGKPTYALNTICDTRECLEKVVESVDWKSSTQAIYYTINKVKETTISSFTSTQRDANKYHTEPWYANYGDWVMDGIKESDIEEVTTFFIDQDAVKNLDENGKVIEQPASAEERQQTLVDLVAKCNMLEKEYGFPSGVLVSSGNGHQVIYKVNGAVAKTFNGGSTDKTTLPTFLRLMGADASTGDLARITKVPGTMTRKGTESVDRPYNRSAYVSVPEEIVSVEVKCLEKYVADHIDEDKVVEKSPPTPSTSTHSKSTAPLVSRTSEYVKEQNLWMRKYINHWDFNLVSILPKDDGSTEYIFDDCPFADGDNAPNFPGDVPTNYPGHSSGDTQWKMWVTADGKKAHKCHHTCPANDNFADFFKRFPFDNKKVVEVNEECLAKTPRKHTTIDALLKLQPPDWLVEQYIMDKEITQLFGQKGTIKTFLCIDFAMSIAYGVDFHGLKVVPGDVVFVASEGNGRRFGDRCNAWLKHHNITDTNNGRFFPVTGRFDLMYKYEVDALIEVVAGATKTPKLIIIDTLSKNFTGKENSDEMKIWTSALLDIQDHFGCAILFVHHTGKDETKGGRGHSSIGCDVDNIFSLSGGGEKLLEKGVTLTCEKIKDDEFTKPRQLMVKKVGTSLVVDSIGEAVAKTKVGKKKEINLSPLLFTLKGGKLNKSEICKKIGISLNTLNKQIELCGDKIEVVEIKNSKYYRLAGSNEPGFEVL